MTDYTLHLTEKQAAEISHACEILARLRMGQIDMALRELPMDKPMEYEQEQYIGNYLRSLYRTDGKRLDDIAWDLHQVIRHRLAWDRAVAELRQEMMGVMYDEPMQVGDEPLAKIESSSGGEKVKSIHDILSDAFREIKEHHGVALKFVDFNLIGTFSGDAHHGFIEAQTVVVQTSRNHEQD